MKKKENLIKKELLFTGERAMPLAPNMDEQVMREDWEKPRYDQLDRALPDIWKENTILYIGAHEGRIQFGDIIRENNLDIDILEIWKPNVDYLRKTVTWFNDVIEGDVRNKWFNLLWHFTKVALGSKT